MHDTGPSVNTEYPAAGGIQGGRRSCGDWPGSWEHHDGALSVSLRVG